MGAASALGSGRMIIILDSFVRIFVVDLAPDVLAEIKAAFTYKNPTHFKLKAMGYKAFKEPANISTWKIENGVLLIPRGGFKKLRAILRNRKILFEIDDRRTLGDPRYAGQIPDYQGHQLRDYQCQAVDAMEKNQNTILRSSTGSGKTSALIALAARLKLPTLVIVWMGSLYEQWIRRVRDELKISDVGEIRGSVRKFRPITIAMQQTLWSRLDDEIKNFPGLVICDEVHRFAARTLLSTVHAFPAHYRVGASDDERRTDQKEFLLYDAFGHPSQDIQYNTLADQGHVIDVDVICVPTNFSPSSEYFNDPDFNVLLDEMTADVVRNDLIDRIVSIAVSTDEQVFVMSHRVQHCVSIVNRLKARGIKAGLLVGAEEYETEFKETLVGMELGTVRVGVGTVQSIGTGLDLPNISVAVAVTPIAGNETTFRQARGRICRTAIGKNSATFYYLMDPLYGRKHVRNLCKWSRRVSVMVNQSLVSGADFLRQ